MYCKYRLEDLADIFCRNLSITKDDPFSEDTVVAQSKTMELYLTKRLADTNGIAANITYPYPRKSIDNILKQCDLIQDTERLTPEVFLWEIYKQMPYLESKYEVINTYINHDNSSISVRRYQLSIIISRIFDYYMGHRGDWLELWQKGERVTSSCMSKAALDLGEHEVWQADLWRKLTVENDNKIEFKRPSQLLFDNLNKIRDKLPEKISIFGISNLPADFIEFYKILDNEIGVDFYYLMPCVEYWGYISKRTAIKEKIDNPLLASWGILGRDFLNLLLKSFENDLGGDELTELPKMTNPTLLSCLQNDILQSTPLKASSLQKLKEPLNDNSILINSCYSRMREIEVLRDYILDLLESGDMGISDIVVMAPDIDEYIPYIQGVFNRLTTDSNEDRATVKFLSEESEAHIPFTIADCSTLWTSKEAETFMKILNIVNSRLYAQDMFDIISSDPVTAKFNLTPDDVIDIHDMIYKANIAWGENREHRKSECGMDNNLNTWEFGFNRLLAGYAFDCEEVVSDGTLPLSLGGEKGILLGKVIQVAKLLFSYNGKLSQEHTPETWYELMLAIINDFFLLPNDKNENLLPLYSAVNALFNNWNSARFDDPIPLDVLRYALQNELTQDERTSSAFFRGSLTFCKLLPMRNIPFKAVCLIGLNDGEFPRIDTKTGFDLSQKESRPGDRSLRKDDRYIFLETILACRKNLYLSYVGQSNSDNDEIPPSVLISELLDYLSNATGRKSNLFIKKHPLHAFDEKYFKEESDFSSFSKVNCEASKSLRSGTNEPQYFCPEKLPPTDTKLEFTFDDFVNFFLSPSKFFLNHRLKINLYNKNMNTLRSCEPFELNSLESYKLKDDFLNHKMENRQFNIEEAKKAEGDIPFGIWGENVITEANSASASLAAVMEDFGAKQPPSSNVVFEYTINGIHISLSGEFHNLYENCQAFFRTGTVKNKDKIKGWLWHQLALEARLPDFTTTILLGYEKDNDKTSKFQIESHSSMVPELVGIFLDGLTKPLPLFKESSTELVKPKTYPDNIDELMKKASTKWEKSQYSYDYDLADEANLICFGENPPFLDEKYKDEFKNLAEQVCLKIKEDVKNKK